MDKAPHGGFHLAKTPATKKPAKSAPQNPDIDLSGVTSAPSNAKKQPAASNKTLYCSFCGKSQHEIRKLIAGPTVFICDECSQVCQEILVEEEREFTTGLPNGNSSIWMSVKIENKFDNDEISTLPSLMKEVEKAFPGCTITTRKYTPLSQADVLSLTVEAPPAYDPNSLIAQVRALTVSLRIEQQKFLAEQSERKRLQDQLANIMTDVFPLLVEKLKSSGDYPGNKLQTMSIMFIDIVGFSHLEEDDRVRSIDLLRSLGRAILRSERGMYLNTWGDAVVAAFDEPASALRCGCKFAQHFNLVGMDARVGVSWGTIRVAVNEIKGTYDIDGSAVNLGARIETLADPGAVLCTEEIGQLVGLESEEFAFTERKLSLKKAVAAHSAGDEITLLEVRSKLN